MPSDRTASDTLRIAKGGPGAAAQLRRMVGRMLRRHRQAEMLFLGTDGQLTPHAADWFATLARENFVDGGGFDADPIKHAFNAGQRHLALKIMRSVDLDTARLGALTRLGREEE